MGFCLPPHFPYFPIFSGELRFNGVCVFLFLLTNASSAPGHAAGRRAARGRERAAAEQLRGRVVDLDSDGRGEQHPPRPGQQKREVPNPDEEKEGEEASPRVTQS